MGFYVHPYKNEVGSDRLHGLCQFMPKSYETDNSKQPYNSPQPWVREGYELWKHISDIVEFDSKEVFFIHLKHYAPTLACVKDYVGGYIECLHLPTGEQLICNEDGHRLELPYNQKASMYANQSILGNVMVLYGKAMLT